MSVCVSQRMQPSVMEAYIKARKEAEKRGHKWAVKALEERVKAGVVRSWGTNPYDHE